jgi:hypothetical protein
LGLIGRLVRAAQWMQWDGRRQVAVALTAAAAILGINLMDAMTGNAIYFETRQMAADAGRWVDREFAARPTLVGPVGITPIVSFYAESTPYRAFRWEAGDATIMALVEQGQTDIVLLRPTKQLTGERCAALTERLRAAGFAPMERHVLPPTCDDLCVLVRGEPARRIAERQTPQRH